MPRYRPMSLGSALIGGSNNELLCNRNIRNRFVSSRLSQMPATYLTCSVGDDTRRNSSVTSFVLSQTSFPSGMTAPRESSDHWL